MAQSVVTLARGWIGTPYRHQASCLGAGADCLGLIRGLWRARLGAEPETLPPYSPRWDEAGEDEALWAALLRHMPPARTPRDGQVLLFRMAAGARAKHLGIAARNGAAFIHACPRAGVIEAALSDPWARRIVARFDWPPIPDQR